MMYVPAFDGSPKMGVTPFSVTSSAWMIGRALSISGPDADAFEAGRVWPDSTLAPQINATAQVDPMA